MLLLTASARWVARWLWFKVLFSEYQWYRRLHGGRWERWNVADPVDALCWVEIPLAAPDHFRLALCRGSRLGFELWNGAQSGAAD